MKQSYLAKQLFELEQALRAEYDARLKQAFVFCEQWYTDMAQVAVAETFDATPDDIKRFVEVFSNNRGDFVDMWNSDAQDCEYTMAKMDERLKEVCGDYFMPYEGRYGGMHLEDLRKKWKRSFSLK